MRARLSRGFSLLELMVTVAIVGVMLAVGVPSFRTWTQNAQTRSAAEAALSGLQSAKNEAIRRNVRVQLTFQNGTGYRINLASDPDGDPLQVRNHDEGSSNATIAMSPADTATVTFNSLGRVSPNADGTSSLTSLTFDNAMLDLADRRPLIVNIPSAGGIRLCDPGVPTGDPRGC
jgi:type IV fimbrial biogenesis protein FimT